MPQDLAEEQDFVVPVLEFRNGHDDCGGLVDHDALESVLLVQVRVQVLLHRLPGLVVHVDALVVVLHFLQVNVSDQVSDLLLSVRDAARVLLVPFQRAVVGALHLKGRKLLLSESWRNEIAAKIVLLRIGLDAFISLLSCKGRRSCLGVALQFSSNDALNLRGLSGLNRGNREV